MSADTMPLLDGDALAAASHRGSHLQIIAAAGSGKTEVVSQRVAMLLAEGVDPAGIVAFTFTERAAAELKQRIARRVEQLAGPTVLDRLGGLFVGTIHGYCFRLLQTAVPRYETFDVLDPNQLTAFLVRESNQLDIRRLDIRIRQKPALFTSIERFLRGVDVVENELLDPQSLDGDFGDVLRKYYDTLDRYRLLTFGQQVVQAVRALDEPGVLERIHTSLRHLIVDEYQDVNPVQERLISLLASGAAELCVVGDDDQAIYQWRGSDVSNIITFADRFAGVVRYRITVNRRSRPTIITEANTFAQTIGGRLDKNMEPYRSASALPEIVAWSAPTEQQEAAYITKLIDDADLGGLPFRDVAVLVRSRAAYRQLLDQFATFGIPVQPGGRSGLFDQPEAEVLGRTFAWLGDIEWGRAFQPRQRIDLKDLLAEYVATFHLDLANRNHLRALLQDWKQDVPQDHRPVDLIDRYYQLLVELDIRSLDLANPINVNRLGTLARFSTLLADYESVRRRARPDDEARGEQVGGTDRGYWYYKHLGIHIVNYANEAYGDFDGEPDVGLDAVDLLTVHAAKGLEWPMVFLPSMTANRFPTKRTGSTQDWPLPRNLFNAARYEGSDDDERRLFYVAMTRARDWLSVSGHDVVGVGDQARPQRTRISPYLATLNLHRVTVADVALPHFESTTANSNEPINVTYSELAQFLDCGMQYRLRTLLGFQPRLAPELGYGKAVHHMLRRLADWTKERGDVPNPGQIATLLDHDFFLPTANKPAHRNLKTAAERLLRTYADKHQDDLHRVWESERPFELRLEGITVTGRADVILDQEGGVTNALAILDYKTSTSADATHDLQLQVYASAGRREGLDVRAGYVHDLKADVTAEGRRSVDLADAAVASAHQTIEQAAVSLRARIFDANPGDRCRQCEVRSVCSSSGVSR